MVMASCLTTQIIQPCGEKGKSNRNDLCMEQLGRRCWSLSWSFMLLWTSERLSESFSARDHIYSYSRGALALLCQCVTCSPVILSLLLAYFISLGAGHRL